MKKIYRFLGGVDVENPTFTNLFIDENFDTPSERHHIIMSSFNSSPVVEDDMFGFYQIGKLFNCMNLNYQRVILCYFIWQECILVGCVPSAAAVAVSVGGVSARGWLPGGGCLGGCLPKGSVCLGGVCLGVCIPPVDRILDTPLWKHYLSATIVAGGNNFHYPIKINWALRF